MFNVTRRSDALVWVLTPAMFGSVVASLLVAVASATCHMLAPFVGWQASKVHEIREASESEIEDRVTEVRRLIESRGYGRAPGFPAASCIGEGTCNVTLTPVQPQPPPYQRDLPVERHTR